MGTTAQVEQFISWIKSLKHIPLKVIIAGNHDIVLDEPFYERRWNSFHHAKEVHKVALGKLLSAGHGIAYLNNSSFQVDGAKLLYKKWQKLSKQKQESSSESSSAEGVDTAGGDDGDNGAGTEGAAADGGGEAVAKVDPREGWSKGYKIWGSPWQPEFYDWAFNEQRGKLKGNL